MDEYPPDVPPIPHEPPPYAPPPPSYGSPSGPPEPPVLPPLPFENRSVPWLNGLLETVVLFTRRPDEAYARMSLTGDLLMFVAVLAWAAYTIGARQLMLRHSPVGVTGLSMAIGTLVYVPLMAGNLAAVPWSGVSVQTWVALVYSALFALCVAYTIWYAAVRQIGSARTSVYSNLIPLVAMATAVVMLGEPLSPRKIAGAGAVLVGVALTRVGRTRIAIPAEE